VDATLRHLVIVLGDQLNEDATALQDFDPARDAVWMAEVAQESTHVPSAKQRTTLFLSAMRHFARRLRQRGLPLMYTALDAPDNAGTLALELEKAILRARPDKLVMTAPGEWRVLDAIRHIARQHAVPLEVRDDTHFFCTVRDFAAHAKGRKQLRMEFFYREMRKKTGILMDGQQPVGGQWNFDADNRASFGKNGPGIVPQPSRFQADDITLEVIALVNRSCADHPGSVDDFGWAVDREQARQALDDFIQHRLPSFGMYQDAMWDGDVWLFHSHVASALNLKLLNPREVIAAAEAAFQRGAAPLAAVEGFIRQILGWREYVRGVYWTHMPAYADSNALDAREPLPDWYWTGDTKMSCLRDAIQQTLAHGYAHHIQRLMVTGLYALLLGVEPQQVHRWYLAVYVDAVEWVEMPNTLGMGQFADGGIMASKPYVASGKYIDRMSNYCKSCPFDPTQATGPTACPFTALYWDFLGRHADTLAKNPRMLMQLKNLNRLSAAERAAIAAQAQTYRASAT